MPRIKMMALSAVVAVAAGLGGCDDDGVRTYRVPKQASPAAVATESGAEVVWSVPAGWTASASNPAPRVATFRAGAGGNLEVSLTRFPGEAGGLAANVNRWRAQLGLDVVPDGEAEAGARRATVGGVEIAVVRIAGGKGMDMVGAVVRPGDGQTWFVKVVGAPADVDAIRPQVDEFVRSFRLERRAAGPGGAAGPQAAAPGAVAPEGVGERLKKWSPPANWKREEDAMAMAAAVYAAEGAAGKARVTLTVLEGGGGGALMNINRWRGQVGLAPLASLEDPSVVRTPEGALVVELKDAKGEKGVVGAIVAEGERTWFFKMTGAPGALAAERGAFDGWVRAGAK